MAEIFENQTGIISQIDKVRRKELQYLVFKMQEENTGEFEIKDLSDRPNKNQQSLIRDEQDLKEAFEKFRESINSHECCYGLFDFESKLPDGRPWSTLFLITFIPDEIMVNKRFTYAFHADILQKNLTVRVETMRINSVEELSYEKVRQKWLSSNKG
ncbi:cofilin [Nematocida sp. AWRm80]|nr:cofilin [Nematocida sp. AWRm80]